MGGVLLNYCNKCRVQLCLFQIIKIVALLYLVLDNLI